MCSKCSSYFCPLPNLDREMVAFANAAGGTIYVGVNDQGKATNLEITNTLKSQIQDIARNCDPSLKIDLTSFLQEDENVLAVHVEEGLDKPYRCKDGFFLRVGPSSQKLKRDEIIQLITEAGSIRFDEAINRKCNMPSDFSTEALQGFLKLCGIDTQQSQAQAQEKDLLVSLGAAIEDNKSLYFTNAGVLFFAKNPQQFFPEAYITCVKYKTSDRFSILDKKDCFGAPIQQIEESLQFLLRHISVSAEIAPRPGGEPLGARRDVYEYPPVALREAITNAVMHRDYLYDSSHIYVHMYADRIEIENPGGLYRELTIENLGKRSIRRNRLVADLLHRAKYIERVGSGFDRMRRALEENRNPPLEVVPTNFFNIRFYPRIQTESTFALSARQTQLYHLIRERGHIVKREAALFLQVSEDTALRELNLLIDQKLITREGTGKAIVYRIL